MIRKSLFVPLFFLSLVLTEAQTILQPGDLAIVELGSNVGGVVGDCVPGGMGALQGRDRVSFICFKDIEPGTVIDITDNGWEREVAGLWGNTEGFVRVTRTGTNIIPAGTVITFELPPQNDDYVAISPDDEWSFQALGVNALNFNDNGDQIFFMQGGNWDNGTVQGCCNGDQDANYNDGRILFAFNSKSDWNAFGMDSQDSGLHPDVVPCFNMAPTSGVTRFTKYNGPMDEVSQLEWVQRLSNPTNWIAYDDCRSFLDAGLFSFIPIGPSNMSITCSACQSCTSFQDTLTLNLPQTGGPFVVEYTDGNDIFTVNNAQNGLQIFRFISTSTTFELVSVADQNGCPVYSNFEDSARVTISDNLSIDVLRQQSALCEGVNSGLIEIGISGGAEPYEIDWNLNRLDGDTLATGLAAGEYSVTVTDAANCTIADTVTIIQTIPLAITCEASMELSDPNSTDGEITISISDGAMPYSLTWTGPDNPGGVVRDNVSNPVGISGLSAGTYDITVTDDSGCMTTCAVTLGEVTCNLDIELRPQDPNCLDENSGAIEVITNGANGTNIDYDWGDININGQSNPSNLSAGFYKVRVTDSAGCMAEDSVQLIAPVDPSISCTVTNNVTTAGGTDGQVRIEVIDNGVAPFKVLWERTSDAQTDSLINLNTPVIDIPNLAAGNYTFILSDANGCTASCSSMISESLCDLQLTLSPEEPTCVSPNSGRIEAVIAGANGQPVYDWNVDSLDGRAQVTSLGPGQYMLTVTDGAGCVAADTVEFAAFDPPLLDCQIINQPSMGGNDGEAQINITGGTPPFQIELNGPTTQSLLSDGTSIIAFTSLVDGVYTVSLVDDAGCESECIFTLGPIDCTLLLELSAVNPDCFNPNAGNIISSVMGAQGEVNYDWNIDSLDNLANANNLAAGTYFLTVTDTAGCMVTDSIVLAIDSDIALDCEVLQDVTTTGASDGIAQLSITGGNAPFAINWAGLNGLSGGINEDSSGVVLIEDLIPGMYMVTVTDTDGCSSPCSFTVRPPTPSCFLSLQLEGASPGCGDPNSGFVEAIVTGATGNVTYDWDNDAFDGLALIPEAVAGSYQLIITDESTCTDTASIVLTDNQNLVVESEVIQPSACSGEGGTIALPRINGGIAPFSASLNGGTPVTVETFPYAFEGLEGGNYELTIADVNGCADTLNFVLEESSKGLTLSLGPDFSINAGENVRLQAIPNFQPTQIIWTASDSSIVFPDSLIVNIRPANDVTISLELFDEFGCAVIDELFIEVDTKTRIFAPNVFTPNGDGVNDLFSLYGGDNVTGVKRFMVFDRWGDLVYQLENFSADGRFGWDGNYQGGEPATQGVYAFFAVVELFDGSEEIVRGDINLIR